MNPLFTSSQNTNLSALWIQHFRSNRTRMRIRMQIQIRTRIQIQGFDDQKIGQKLQLKKITLLRSKIAVYLSLASTKDIQATGDASALKKGHPALLNMNFLNFFYFVGLFCPPELGSGIVFSMRIRIRIQPTKINVDPCKSGSGSGSETLALQDHTFLNRL